MSEIHIENRCVYTIVETFRVWVKKNSESRDSIDAVRNYIQYLLGEEIDRLGPDLRLSQREIDHIRLIFSIDMTDCLEEESVDDAYIREMEKDSYPYKS